MEGVSEQASGPSVISVDKSRVFDVKPLKTLVPMFPNPPEAPPFVCSAPFGPFPAGFTPFYPFSVPQGARNSAEPQPQTESAFKFPNQDGAFATPAAAVPLRSFGTPQMGVHFSGASNGDTDSSMEYSRDDVSFGFSGDGFTSGKKRGRPPGSSKKILKRDREMSAEAIKTAIQDTPLCLTQAQRENGDRDLVNYIMLKFDAIRRRLCQLEDSKDMAEASSKRADLRSGNIMMSTGVRTNMTKRVGAIPGIVIGDIFYFRMEMCVIGLHAPSMAGIDYMSVRFEADDEPLAVSIVSSGGYDDNAEDKDFIVYTGQGGNLSYKGKAVSDQKLVRGNLALDKSSRRVNEIRVIRSVKDPHSPTPVSKVYFYDGLYTIQESWVEKAKSGVNSFKYKLVRVPGQSSAFSIWQSVQSWKAGHSTRPGLILPDLTSGAESIPVSLVNDVDDEKGPQYFTYFSGLRYSQSFNLSEPSRGCSCRKDCAPGNLNCSCNVRNAGDFPYTANGVLVCRKPLIYECGSSCPCQSNCKNRVSQSALKLPLEVFKTKDKGWGLRSWDPIRAGSFICEYAGEVLDKSKFNDVEDNNYVFDTSRTYDKSFKWNYDPVFLGEETPVDSSQEFNVPSTIMINAKDVGNVARFMNHSCSPNVFWQPIAYEQNGESVIHIGFFAIRHIPPLTELTYDYGISQSELRRQRCLCRSPKCKGYFG